MDLLDYAGNEVLIIKGSDYRGVVAISTGDRDLFDVEISIRAGITKKLKMNFDNVAQLFVDSIINGKTLKSQMLFKGGFPEAVEYCRKKYRENGGEPIKYASLEDSDYEKTLLAPSNMPLDTI